MGLIGGARAGRRKVSPPVILRKLIDGHLLSSIVCWLLAEVDLATQDPNQNSVSSRGSRPQSRSRPSSMFRGAFGHMAGPAAGGTGTSTPRSEWEGFEFNPATARKEELRYAEGDVGRSKFAKGYFYLLNKSIITRWFLYIIPVLVVSLGRSGLV